jgi:hypothetical protein
MDIYEFISFSVKSDLLFHPLGLTSSAAWQVRVHKFVYYMSYRNRICMAKLLCGDTYSTK